MTCLLSLILERPIRATYYSLSSSLFSKNYYVRNTKDYTAFVKHCYLEYIHFFVMCLFSKAKGKNVGRTFVTLKKPGNNGVYLQQMKPFQIQNAWRTQLLTILLKLRWMSPSRFQSHLSLVTVIFNIKSFL